MQIDVVCSLKLKLTFWNGPHATLAMTLIVKRSYIQPSTDVIFIDASHCCTKEPCCMDVEWNKGPGEYLRVGKKITGKIFLCGYVDWSVTEEGFTNLEQSSHNLLRCKEESSFNVKEVIGNVKWKTQNFYLHYFHLWSSAAHDCSVLTHIIMNAYKSRFF